MESLDLAQITTSPLDVLIVESPPPDNRQRLLRISLGGQDTALLPLEQITEILKVDKTHILSIPEMPNCVLGVCDWQGKMLWLVDLNNLIGYPSVFQPTDFQPTGFLQAGLSTAWMILVVEVRHHCIGIVVQQVNDIELHSLQDLQPIPPGLFPPNFLPLILGTLPGCCDPVLNLHAIAQGPLWKNHPEQSV